MDIPLKRDCRSVDRPVGYVFKRSPPGEHLGSFKFRLVTYFLLLSLFPLLAASWAFSEVAARGELGRADSRLNAALRVASQAYSDEVAEGAGATVRRLAQKQRVQRALHSGNRGALLRIARETPNTAFFESGQLLAGDVPGSPSARRSAQVVTESGEVIAEIVTWLPLNRKLVDDLRTRAAMEDEDQLVIVSDGFVIAGPEGIRGALERVDHPRFVKIGDA